MSFWRDYVENPCMRMCQNLPLYSFCTCARARACACACACACPCAYPMTVPVPVPVYLGAHKYKILWHKLSDACAYALQKRVGQLGASLFRQYLIVRATAHTPMPQHESLHETKPFMHERVEIRNDERLPKFSKKGSEARDVQINNWVET